MAHVIYYWLRYVNDQSLLTHWPVGWSVNEWLSSVHSRSARKRVFWHHTLFVRGLDWLTVQDESYETFPLALGQFWPENTSNDPFRCDPVAGNIPLSRYNEIYNWVAVAESEQNCRFRRCSIPHWYLQSLWSATVKSSPVAATGLLCALIRLLMLALHRSCTFFFTYLLPSE